MPRHWQAFRRHFTYLLIGIISAIGSAICGSWRIADCLGANLALYRFVFGGWHVPWFIRRLWKPSASWHKGCQWVTGQRHSHYPMYTVILCRRPNFELSTTFVNNHSIQTSQSCLSMPLNWIRMGNQSFSKVVVSCRFLHCLSTLSLHIHSLSLGEAFQTSGHATKATLLLPGPRKTDTVKGRIWVTDFQVGDYNQSYTSS